MKRVVPILILAAAAAVVGCQSERLDALLGRGPIAAGALYRQAETVVLIRDREAFPECKERKVEKTALLEAPEVVAMPQESRDTVSFSGTGTPNSYVVPVERRFSRFVEQWTVRHCGSNYLYRVTFLPSRDGMVVDAVPDFEANTSPQP